MRRDTWAVWMLAVMFLALPAVAEEAPLPSVDLGGSAGPLQLEGVARRTADEWFGWAGDQLVVTQDGGKSWTGAGRVPQTPIRALVFPKDGRLFAETGAGKLLASRDSGHSWELSKGWLEPYDFAVAAGRKLGEAAGAAASPAEFPLDCLLTAPASVVKVRTGVQAGAAKSQGVLELAVASDRASLSGEKLEGEESQKLAVRKLSREEALRITQSLVEAVKRQEEPAGCAAGVKTVIEWSCNPEQSWRRKVELQAGECGASGAYLRGLAVQELASRTLDGSSR